MEDNMEDTNLLKAAKTFTEAEWGWLCMDDPARTRDTIMLSSKKKTLQMMREYWVPFNTGSRGNYGYLRDYYNFLCKLGYTVPYEDMVKDHAGAKV